MGVQMTEKVKTEPKSPIFEPISMKLGKNVIKVKKEILMFIYPASDPCMTS